MTVFDFTILAALVVVAVLGFFVLLIMIGSRLSAGLMRHFRSSEVPNNVDSQLVTSRIKP